MSAKSVEELTIPHELIQHGYFDSANQLMNWEKEVAFFFSSEYKLFTQFPEYFKIRCYEFQLLKQLLPEYFDFKPKYERGLEIGCGFGFKSLLLSNVCRRLHSTDIPVKYEGYVVGNYNSSMDLAKLLVNEKFKTSNVRFEANWPDNLASVESESIAFLFSEYTLEHIPDLPKAISEMHRVMEKNAIMLHTVPKTSDAYLEFILAQIDMSPISIIKILVKKLLGRSNSRIKLNGVIIPHCHSEFIDDFAKQLEIYSLEYYVFSMLEAGFRVEKIISTREHNHVIVARK